MIKEYTHVAYADESRHNEGRFGGVAIVTAERDSALELNEKVTSTLKDSDVNEFKWKKVRSAKYRFCAIKIINDVLESVGKGGLRVDMLIWDKQNPSLPKDPAIYSLGKKYYHLLKNVFIERWPAESIWRICPDEQNGIDWAHEIKNILENISREKIGYNNNGKINLSIKQNFLVESVETVDSAKNPMVQVADLFAGVGTFSYNRNHETLCSSGQTTLQGELVRQTASGIEMSNVLNNLLENCRKIKYGVYLNGGGLKTFDPYCPINFWFFRPEKSKKYISKLDRFC